MPAVSLSDEPAQSTPPRRQNWSDHYPVRFLHVIEAVITGVSFLGGGIIIRRGSVAAVEGLTTAASLLFVAGEGIAVALSQLVLALATLGVLYVFSRWSGRH